MFELLKTKLNVSIPLAYGKEKKHEHREFRAKTTDCGILQFETVEETIASKEVCFSWDIAS